MSLFEHFVEVLSCYLEASIRIRIQVRSKLKGRIRIRIKVTSRIRIRINVMRIRNTAKLYRLAFYWECAFSYILRRCQGYITGGT
jgi:hypothetical protein